MWLCLFIIVTTSTFHVESSRETHIPEESLARRSGSQSSYINSIPEPQDGFLEDFSSLPLSKFPQFNNANITRPEEEIVFQENVTLDENILSKSDPDATNNEKFEKVLPEILTRLSEDIDYSQQGDSVINDDGYTDGASKNNTIFLIKDSIQNDALLENDDTPIDPPNNFKNTREKNTNFIVNNIFPQISLNDQDSPIEDNKELPSIIVTSRTSPSESPEHQVDLSPGQFNIRQPNENTFDYGDTEKKSFKEDYRIPSNPNNRQSDVEDTSNRKQSEGVQHNNNFYSSQPVIDQQADIPYSWQPEGTLNQEIPYETQPAVVPESPYDRQPEEVQQPETLYNPHVEYEDEEDFPYDDSLTGDHSTIDYDVRYNPSGPPLNNDPDRYIPSRSSTNNDPPRYIPSRQSNKDQQQTYKEEEIVLEEGEEKEEDKEPDRLQILLQESDFTCADKKDGYYADEKLHCEVFHFCKDKNKHSWLCPNGASFHQVHLVCMPRSEDNICERSPQFYFVNDFLYKEVESENKNASKAYADRYYPEDFSDGIAKVSPDEKESSTLREYYLESTAPLLRPDQYHTSQPRPPVDHVKDTFSPDLRPQYDKVVNGQHHRPQPVRVQDEYIPTYQN